MSDVGKKAIFFSHNHTTQQTRMANVWRSITQPNSLSSDDVAGSRQQYPTDDAYLIYEHYGAS